MTPTKTSSVPATPVRVQKIIAEAGLASRREAERWIQEGRVQVNGRVVSLGDRADPGRDSVRVDGRRVRPRPGEKTYLLLNKPKGYVTTVSDPDTRDTVMDLLPESLRRGVKPVGRLDVQTEGLLLLTDDGDLARLVTHPSSGCRKQYRVKVSGVPTEKSLVRLRRGIPLDGRRTRPCEIALASTTGKAGEGNAWLDVTLSEGRTRQIRRMFETVGHPVSKLKRVAIGPIRDDRLPPGGYRALARTEVESLRRSVRAPFPPPSAGELRRVPSPSFRAGRLQGPRPGKRPGGKARGQPAETSPTATAGLPPRSRRVSRPRHDRPPDRRH